VTSSEPAGRARGGAAAGARPEAAYEQLGPLYDAWCRSVIEDVDFYVELALASGGPVLEVGVGSGRIAVPTLLAGVDLVGVDASPRMLELARRKAEPHGLRPRLVCADMRALPELGRFALVTVPFRAFLHLRDDGERLGVLRALRRRLRPGGLLAFDVFHPDREDIEQTHGRWLEREPGIWERALWYPAERRLELAVRCGPVLGEMELWWQEPETWRELLERAGYAGVERFGWFDRRPPAAGDADSVFLARAAAR
jgi:SAM-dependent methyltransferase